MYVLSTKIAARLACLLLVSLSAAANAADVTYFNDGPLAGQDLPFSGSVRVGDLLLLSGQIGSDSSGRVVRGGIGAEAEQIMLNIAAELDRRGLVMRDVVKCTVFLADMKDWGAFNEVYVRHFEKPYPARSALGSTGLALGARAEVECIAAYR